jgi:hypothetical protein
MSFMDQFSQGAPTSGDWLKGSFVKAETKAQLWVNKTPFEIMAAQFVGRNPQFMRPRQDGTMPDPNEWRLQIRLMEYQGDGTFRYILEDDGEGGRSAVDYVLTFDPTPTRNHVFQNMATYLKDHPSVGPFRLDKEEKQNKFGQKPWVIVDWTPPFVATQSAPSVATTAPSMPLSSPTPAATAPTSSQGKEYTHFGDHPTSGKKLGWHDGLPDWEEIPIKLATSPPPLPVGPPPLPVGAAPTTGEGVPPPPSPPPGQSSQPIPATRILQGFTRDPEGNVAGLTQEVTDGTQIRQAVYQGDGVVAQPSGVKTQNAAGPEPRTRAEAGGMGPTPGLQAAQMPVVAEGGLGVEAAASVAEAQPQPSQGPYSVQVAQRQAYDARQPVAITINCDVCYEKVSTPAWWDKREGGHWKQSHQCSKTKDLRTLTVDEFVKQTVGVV